MNCFYEHHRDGIRWHYRCFDRILLNGLIQPFQQPERVVGFFNTYRQLYPLTRAINVLSLFDHARPQLSLSEIAQAVSLPKTTVFRLLSSLVERDFCELDAQSGKYSLGFGLLRLADVRRRQTNIHDVAIPVMRDLRNQVQETVILSSD